MDSKSILKLYKPYCSVLDLSNTLITITSLKV
jgi:hypothetical protein